MPLASVATNNNITSKFRVAYAAIILIVLQISRLKNQIKHYWIHQRLNSQLTWHTFVVFFSTQKKPKSKFMFSRKQCTSESSIQGDDLSSFFPESQIERGRSCRNVRFCAHPSRAAVIQIVVRGMKQQQSRQEKPLEDMMDHCYAEGKGTKEWGIPRRNFWVWYGWQSKIGQ